MKKFLLFMLMPVLLWSFNRLQYNELLLGTPIDQVIARYGDPYSIHRLGNGILEYEYIERVSQNNVLMFENHYFLTVVNDQVVNKRVREETSPPYDLMYQEDPNYPSYP